MRMFTENQLKIVLVLMDNKGYSQRGLARYLKKSDSNLNPILKKLKNMGVIREEGFKASKAKHKKEGTYNEKPYYLSNDLDGIKLLAREIALSGKILNAGFVLSILRDSEYFKDMKAKFGENLAENIVSELKISYPPILDDKFSVLHYKFNEALERLFHMEPTKAEVLYEETLPSSLELWYRSYLKMRESEKD
jgi:DNA-binding Lrp family transcriptional regulator